MLCIMDYGMQKMKCKQSKSDFFSLEKANTLRNLNPTNNLKYLLGSVEAEFVTSD